jgi:hypothetical protein
MLTEALLAAAVKVHQQQSGQSMNPYRLQGSVRAAQNLQLLSSLQQQAPVNGSSSSSSSSGITRCCSTLTRPSCLLCQPQMLLLFISCYHPENHQISAAATAHTCTTIGIRFSSEQHTQQQAVMP